MKRVIFLSGIILCFFVASAKNPPVVAAKLNIDLKHEISSKIYYPLFAEDQQIEGEVWLKLCVDNEFKIRIIDLSATDPALGRYVRESLTDLFIKNPNCSTGEEYYLKVKFDLLSK